MAQEISLAYTTAADLYAILKTATGTFVNGTTPEAFNPAHWGAYAVPLAEFASSDGQYRGDMPALAAGLYRVEVYLRAGVSPATTDGPPVAEGEVDWSGTAVRTQGAVQLDLDQPLADVRTATVGGALHGGWAVAFGRMILDSPGALLKLFGSGSQSVPLITFTLDDGDSPSTRTPQ